MSGGARFCFLFSSAPECNTSYLLQQYIKKGKRLRGDRIVRRVTAAAAVIDIIVCMGPPPVDVDLLS